MTAETQDASAALDVMDEIVTLERAEPDVLLSELATLMLGLQGDSPYRPRVHRLLGVVQMRLNRGDDAMRELAEAKTLAEAQSPPDNLELARIERETAAIHRECHARVSTRSGVAQGRDGNRRPAVRAVSFAEQDGDYRRDRDVAGAIDGHGIPGPDSAVM